MKKIKH